jgi:hypothetical protein
MRRSLSSLAVVLAAAAAVAAPAWAHGDPASEYLVDHEVFFPLYAPLGEEEQLKLAALVREANAKGFPIRLALIATRRDLGTEGDAWLKPADYAAALDQDLVYYYRGRLLVAMPNGFGLVYPKHGVASATRLLARIRPGATPAGLAAAATTAIERLAAAEGVRVAPPAQVTTPAQRNRHDRIVIAVAALVALALWWVVRRVASRRSAAASA